MSTPYEAGFDAGQAVQPGQAVTIPNEYADGGETNQQYIDGLQAGMNAAVAAAQAPPAAPVAPPQTFTLPAAQEPPVAPPAAQAPAQAVSMLQQMAAELDVAPPVVPDPTVTSNGGFALLEGLEEDLDKGSGKPFLFENVGDKLIGYVRYRDEIRSDYPNQKTGEYGMVMLLDIETAEGELYSVRGYGSALSSQLEKANPRVGDALAIKFIGMEQPKTAGYQAYKNYSVRCNHA